MSVIDFAMDIQRKQDPMGVLANITMSSKFLPYRSLMLPLT